MCKKSFLSPKEVIYVLTFWPICAIIRGLGHGGPGKLSFCALSNPFADMEVASGKGRKIF